ncbi:hypothetical protein ACSFA0_22865 [Variovorax sp. LT1P1]|uniref:hypothetical protein n=1 Tax=Variovorax sp. LT1P1 TaxID=3443730 RepID=UPI003F44B028
MELAGLRRAVRMMGVDPARLASFGSADGDAVSKAILLQNVGLDEMRLRAAVGDDSNIDGRKTAWERLLVGTELSADTGRIHHHGLSGT